MAMLVVLLEADGGDVPLGSRAVNRLARLGVTNVALLRDEQTVCMVLEGWAFDPACSAPRGRFDDLRGYSVRASAAAGYADSV